MVQILDALPTFGQGLIQALSSAGSQFGAGLAKKKEKDLLGAFENIVNNPKASAISKVTAFSQLPEHIKKSTAPIYAAVLGPQAQGEADLNAAKSAHPDWFEEQFKSGQQPQQEGDPNNIKPSTTGQAPQMGAPGLTRDRQGLSQGNQTAAQPGLNAQTSVGAGNIDPAQKALLIEESKYAGSKNKYENERGKRAEAQLKRIEKQEDVAREDRREAHKESAAFDKEIQEGAKRAQQQITAVKDISEALASGKVRPGAVSNVFRNLGPVGEKISEAFKSAEQGKFEANIPQLLEGWKEVFGVRLSDADLKILQSKLPDIGKSPEANKAVLDVISRNTKAPLLRAEIASQIKSQNGGMRPLNFSDMVEKEFQLRQEASRPVRIKGPDGGIYSVPKDQVEGAIQAGGQLIQ